MPYDTRYVDNWHLDKLEFSSYPKRLAGVASSRHEGVINRSGEKSMPSRDDD
jgi:hypothetical protein